MKTYKTPGVYIKEEPTFGRSISSVDSAVPAFLGLTEKGEGKVRKINSMKDFEEVFGKREPIKVSLNENNEWELDGRKSYLYDSLLLYFRNGGEKCYVVSLGGFGQVNVDNLGDGLKKLEVEAEPTLVVCPEITRMTTANARGGWYKAILKHCQSTQKRFAILDATNSVGDQMRTDSISQLAEGALDWGAMYYPYVKADVLKEEDIEIDVFGGDNNALFQYLALPEHNQIRDLQGATLEKALIATVPAYRKLVKEVAAKWNTLPPSGAIAGVIVKTDRSRGVQKAPANVQLNGVVDLTYHLTDKEQEELNVPIDGKAINCLRSFLNEGIKVWGARTLDGNSIDWRYINVRRTMIMLQQSIKNHMIKYLFEPNEQSTWIKIRTSLKSYLTKQWQAGTLTGDTPDQAFDFAIGLGETMTQEEINDGIMRLSVKLAIARPAEFIEVVFEQKQNEIAGAGEGGEGEEGGEGNEEGGNG